MPNALPETGNVTAGALSNVTVISSSTRASVSPAANVILKSTLSRLSNTKSLCNEVEKFLFLNDTSVIFIVCSPSFKRFNVFEVTALL